MEARPENQNYRALTASFIKAKNTVKTAFSHGWDTSGDFKPWRYWNGLFVQKMRFCQNS
jgi:hypothetical protein